jgi:hypothetical protein
MLLEARYNANLEGTIKFLPALEVVNAHIYLPMR